MLDHITAFRRTQDILVATIWVNPPAVLIWDISAPKIGGWALPGVDEAVAVCVAVNVAVGSGVDVVVAVRVAVFVFVNVALGSGVNVMVGVRVAVFVFVNVAVDRVRVAVLVSVGVAARIPEALFITNGR